MIKYKSNCAVCKLLKENKKLTQRIFESSYFIPHSEESLYQIFQDYNKDQLFFSYPSLLNHVKKHQFISVGQYQTKMIKHAEEKMEIVAAHKAVQRVKAADAVQSVIERGNQRLEDGEINVSTGELLRASQIKLTQESKEKDQQLQILEMIASFASGSQSKKLTPINDDELLNYDPTIPTTPYN